MPTQLLNDTQVEEQADRWEDAIEKMQQSAQWDLWAIHANNLELTPCRGWCDTAAVDGKRLFFNPEFSASLSDARLLFVLIHETWHIAGGHLWRMSKYTDGVIDPKERKKIHKRTNQATDYVIHADMVPRSKDKANLDVDIDFPTCGIYSDKFVGMSAEEVYDWLLANPDSPEAKAGAGLDLQIIIGSGKGPPGSTSDGKDGWVLVTDEEGNPLDIGRDDPIPGVGVTVEELQEIAAKAASDIREGGQTGSDGASTKTRSFEAEREAKTPWMTYLQRFCIQAAKSDYSWSRPNRRTLHRGMITPSLHSNKLSGVICVDVSGSIDRKLLKVFGAEIMAIRGQIPDHELHILSVSSEVTHTQHIMSGQNMEMEVKGGGGTGFVPAFNWVRDNVQNPGFMIYFTDGYNSTSDAKHADFHDQQFPILWALYGDERCKARKQPFGENLVLKGPS